MAHKLMTSARRRPVMPRTRMSKRLERSRPEYISKREGLTLLDRQARKYLNMSGDEFRRRYQMGDIHDLDPKAVRRLSFIVPMSED